MAGIWNSVNGGVFWHATAVLVAVANMVGVKARVVNRKQVDVTSFPLSWNVLIAHCTRGRGAQCETGATVSLSTVPRLSLLPRQSCRLQVGKRTRGERWVVSPTPTRGAFTQNQMTWHLDAYRCCAEVRGSFQKTAPRKTAKNTAKHRDGGVDSVVANHDMGKSLVVVTTLT